MEMRSSSGSNIANEEGRTRAALGIPVVMQRWGDWHATDGASAARACGSCEDCVNQARCSMSLKCCKVRIKIHPFRLPLLLIDVRDPHERRTSCLERGQDLGDKEMWNHTGVERTWAKHDQVGLADGTHRRWCCARPFRCNANSVNVSRACELRLTPHESTICRCANQFKRNGRAWNHLSANIEDAMHACHAPLKISPLLVNRSGEQKIANCVPPGSARLCWESEAQEIRCG
jgi:hypothetical protein